MYEFIGLILVGAMFALLELSAPLLQERRSSPQGPNPMLEDAIAMALLTMGLVGGTIIFVQVVSAVETGNDIWIAIASAAAIIGTPVVTAICRRLGRAAAGRRLAAGGAA